MTSSADLDIAAGTRPAVRPDTVPGPRGANDTRDPWLRAVPDSVLTTVPVPGQLGHGKTASLRRQPARIVDGRMEGGYTDVFELICPSCGDHPYLDYSDVRPRLQSLRGPHTLEAGLAAYERHLGLLSRPPEASP
jgi:hypothetical protein